MHGRKRRTRRGCSPRGCGLRTSAAGRRPTTPLTSRSGAERRTKPGGPHIGQFSKRQRISNHGSRKQLPPGAADREQPYGPLRTRPAHAVPTNTQGKPQARERPTQTATQPGEEAPRPENSATAGPNAPTSAERRGKSIIQIRIRQCPCRASAMSAGPPRKRWRAIDQTSGTSEMLQTRRRDRRPKSSGNPPETRTTGTTTHRPATGHVRQKAQEVNDGHPKRRARATTIRPASQGGGNRVREHAPRTDQTPARSQRKTPKRTRACRPATRIERVRNVRAISSRQHPHGRAPRRHAEEPGKQEKQTSRHDVNRPKSIAIERRKTGTDRRRAARSSAALGY